MNDGIMARWAWKGGAAGRCGTGAGAGSGGAGPCLAAGRAQAGMGGGSGRLAGGLPRPWCSPCLCPGSTCLCPCPRVGGREMDLCSLLLLLQLLPVQLLPLQLLPLPPTGVVGHEARRARAGAAAAPAAAGPLAGAGAAVTAAAAMAAAAVSASSTTFRERLLPRVGGGTCKVCAGVLEAACVTGATAVCAAGGSTADPSPWPAVAAAMAAGGGAPSTPPAGSAAAAAAATEAVVPSSLGQQAPASTSSCHSLSLSTSSISAASPGKPPLEAPTVGGGCGAAPAACCSAGRPVLPCMLLPPAVAYALLGDGVGSRLSKDELVEQVWEGMLLFSAGRGAGHGTESLFCRIEMSRHSRAK